MGTVKGFGGSEPSLTNLRTTLLIKRNKGVTGEHCICKVTLAEREFLENSLRAAPAENADASPGFGAFGQRACTQHFINWCLFSGVMTWIGMGLDMGCDRGFSMHHVHSWDLSRLNRCVLQRI